MHREAAKAYRRLQKPVKDRVRAAIDALADDPRPPGAVKLAGRDDYRVRVGDYRLVYAIDDSDRVVLVARIAHRRDVYRH
jgi:mRNA interferase RelE/StbE